MVSSVGCPYLVLCILSSSQLNRVGNSVLRDSCLVSSKLIIKQQQVIHNAPFKAYAARR